MVCWSQRISIPSVAVTLVSNVLPGDARLTFACALAPTKMMVRAEPVGPHGASLAAAARISSLEAISAMLP